MKRDRLHQYQRRLVPDTPLCAGLDRILHGCTGALIVLGNNPKVQQVSIGGFRLDVESIPQVLRELAKPDGAIILSNDLSRIIAAGARLVPAGDLSTAETGTRHHLADRTAQVPGVPVVTVSALMSTTSLFVDGDWHVVETSGQMIGRASQTLATLSRFVNRLGNILHQFNVPEVGEQVIIRGLVLVAQRFEMTRRLSAEAQFHIDTLGIEGRLIVLQHAEPVDELTDLDEQLRTDYAHNFADPFLFTLEPLYNFSAEELLSSQLVAERIGFSESPYLETPIHTCGACLLISVGRLPEGMTTKLINRFSLQELFSVSVLELQQFEGIGSARTRPIHDTLLRITEVARAHPQTPV